jgi:hypothetical protein
VDGRDADKRSRHFDVGSDPEMVVSFWLPIAVRSGFNPRSGHVVFVLDKVALGHVLFKYFSFSFQFSFRRTIHTLPHSGLVQ